MWNVPRGGDTPLERSGHARDASLTATPPRASSRWSRLAVATGATVCIHLGRLRRPDWSLPTQSTSATKRKGRKEVSSRSGSLFCSTMVCTSDLPSATRLPSIPHVRTRTGANSRVFHTHVSTQKDGRVEGSFGHRHCTCDPLRPHGPSRDDQRTLNDPDELVRQPSTGRELV